MNNRNQQTARTTAPAEGASCSTYLNVFYPSRSMSRNGKTQQEMDAASAQHSLTKKAWDSLSS